MEGLAEVGHCEVSLSAHYAGFALAEDCAGSGADDESFLVEESLLLYLLAEVLEQGQILSRELALEFIYEIGVSLSLIELYAEVMINQHPVFLQLFCFGQLLPDASELTDQII